MKYNVLFMAGLMIGGLCFLSCHQQGKSQQAEDATRNEEAAIEEEEEIVSKDKDWSERVIVFKQNKSTDTLTLYRDGTATNNVSSSIVGYYSLKGYWEFGSFIRGDMQFSAIKVNFSTEYNSNVYYMEANAHEGDFVYRKYESMLKKTDGYKIILDEVYR